MASSTARRRCHFAVPLSLRAVPGAGNGPPTLSHPHFALLDRHSGPEPPNQPPFPPDAHWPGTAWAFPEQRRTFFGARLRLRPTRGVDSLLPRHGAPQGPTFGRRVTMGYGGLEKSARVRRKIAYSWSDVWTTRGRSSFPSLRRATRPQRGRTRYLVPPGSRSQRVPSGDPT